jgi:hypothetical protein
MLRGFLERVASSFSINELFIIGGLVMMGESDVSELRPHGPVVNLQVIAMWIIV